ncbi:hypothetical protein [Krasilnikovia sp. M28-CT-15]|uniref:hypothetical protein n=1 Tax=Krasilnikovia sp. M28-CT-15 TaxID=3373540 RepID=UPI0038776FB4
MPDPDRSPAPLSALLNEMISRWYLVEFPQARRRGTKAPQGAYARLGQAIGKADKQVSKIVNDTFEKNTRELSPERSRNAWPAVVQMVQVCVSAPEQAKWTQRLAGLWMAAEGGGVERPPGYVDDIRTPDGQLLPAMTDPAQTDRADLKAPLLHRQLAAQHSLLVRLRDQHRRLRDRDQAARITHHRQQAAQHERVQHLTEELEHAQQDLRATERGLAQLQHLLDTREQELAEQSELHEAQRQAATDTLRRLEHEQANLLQYLLAEQTRQNQRIEAMLDGAAAERTRLEAERDAAARFAADEAAQRRELQHRLTAADRELVAARAHIDQLTAELAEHTTTIARLTTTGTRDAVPAAAHEPAGAGGASRPAAGTGVPAPRHHRSPAGHQDSAFPASPEFSPAREIPADLGSGAAIDPPVQRPAPPVPGSRPASAPRRSWHKVLGMVAVVTGIPGLGILIVNTAGLPEKLDYASGDRPTVTGEPGEAACVGDACVVAPGTTTLAWKLTPASRAITTTLTPVDGPKPGKTTVGGWLRLTKPCPGSTVSWQVDVNRSAATHGTLTTDHPEQSLDYATSWTLHDVTFHATLTTGTCETSVEWTTGHH